MININFFLLKQVTLTEGLLLALYYMLSLCQWISCRLCFLSQWISINLLSTNIDPVVVAWKYWNKILVRRKLEKVKDLKIFILVSPFYHLDIPHSAYCISDSYTLLWSLDNDSHQMMFLDSKSQLLKSLSSLSGYKRLKKENVRHLIDPSPMRTSIVSVAPSFLW